jgi:hypothetical protein
MSNDTTSTTAQLVAVEPAHEAREQQRALAEFSAGYSGTTLEAYRLDLRQWVAWLDTAGLAPFAVERPVTLRSPPSMR